MNWRKSHRVLVVGLLAVATLIGSVGTSLTAEASAVASSTPLHSSSGWNLVSPTNWGWE